jgi:hypothetical protein
MEMTRASVLLLLLLSFQTFPWEGSLAAAARAMGA